MTSRRRNLPIILAVIALLVGAAFVITDRPTRLGLDLRGGVELVYEGQPTPQVPEVTPQAIEDSIETIRKRTDALGVSEPEIQQAGATQISIGLPDVQNVDRAIEQVGTTAQLQFYDYEPNVLTSDGELTRVAEAQQSSGEPAESLARPLSLFDAVERASEAQPTADIEDLPPGGPDPAVVERFGDDDAQVQQYYDGQNDTAGDKYYLFGPDEMLLAGPGATCEELLSDFEVNTAGAGDPAGQQAPKGTECAAELAALGAEGPPEGSQVLKVPRGIVVVRASRPPNLPAGAPFDRYVIFEDDSELSGDDIRNPEQNFDSRTQQPVVTMDFTDEGREAFAAVTQRIAQRGAEQIRGPGVPPELTFQRFAITLDDEVVSLATIDYIENPEGIDGRTGAQITDIGSLEETQDLAESLRIGALPIQLKLISNTQVSASLGQQALDQGLLAAGAGLALTLLFLVAFYRVLGVVAAVALVTYAVLLFALVKLIPITLTLPGIAGLILTLGVAADANIVIFERVKEEVRAGRSVPAAISAGYGKALRTIIDANVVTIGVAFILFMLATAGVKGFALTLGIGTLVSLFTAVLATSAVLGSISRTRPLRSRHALGAGEERVRWRFDFMGNSKWFFSMSGVILAAGALAIAGLGINFGIDFESGTRIKTPLEQPATVDQVRQSLPAPLQDAEIQRVEEPDLGETVYQISTPTLQPGQEAQVRDALDGAFGVVEADFSSSSIGPTFGAQVARTAVIAIIASLLLISLYIGLRFEFKFAVPVLIALAHDLLITAGVYALTEREVTTATVAALLTILGYSLYDTIIVFDRIRENVPRMPRATFTQIVNRSMSEVLTRSLVTSLSTLLPISALMLFGGETLRDFGFALLIGVLSGTYSSIFIASPVLSAWKEREPIYRRRRLLALEDHGGVVPAFTDGSLGDRGDGGAARSQRVPGRSERARKAATPEPSREPEPSRAVVPPADAVTATAPAAAPAPAPAETKLAEPEPEPADDDDGASGDGDGDGNGDGSGSRASRPTSGQRRRKKHGRR